MTSIKQTHQDYGLSATLTIRTTGQQVTVFFPKGESEVPVGLSVGPFAIEGKLSLHPVNAPDGDPDLKMVLDFSVREKPSVEASAKLTAPASTTAASEAPAPTAPESQAKVEAPTAPEVPVDTVKPSSAPAKPAGSKK